MTKSEYIEWRIERLRKAQKKVIKRLSKLSDPHDFYFIYCDNLLKAYSKEIDDLIKLIKS